MLQNPHGERQGANACGAQGTCASFDVDHLIQSVGSRSCDDMPRLNTMLRPEHELLLCCGSPAMSPAAERRLHELVQSRIEWSDVFRSAGRHGVAPLLHRALASDPRSSIPASLYDAFERHVIACGMQSRLLMRRSADTLRLFEKDGLRALVFKGGILAKLAYGDVALRQFTDLDLLVHRDDYDRARTLLVRHGYRQHADYGWESTYLGDALLPVDLHFSLTPTMFPVPLDFDGWWRRRQLVDVEGYEMPTLSHEDLTIVLAVQISKDAASGTLRLAKLYDLAHLIAHKRDLDWTVVAQESNRLRVRGMLAFAVELVATLLRQPIPAPAAAMTRPRPRLRSLIARQTREVFQEIDAKGPTRRRLIAFHWHLREDLRDKLWPFLAIALETVTPNDWDRAVIRLPRSLFALYYVIRPLRLAWTYGRPHANSRNA
jgi:hypothetical protein